MNRLAVLPLLFAASTADARKERASNIAFAKVPSIEDVVTAEGFVPTPSQSEIYKPGAVLVPNERGSHDVVVESCVDAEPSISVMSQSSIAATLAGGVSARLGVARGVASAGVEKRLSFVDPEQRTISLAKLRPTPECSEGVQTAATFEDLSNAIVLHDVLVAVIKNTVCARADASGGVVALGEAEAAVFAECVQESDGQVPLGYKAVPLRKLLSVEPAGIAHDRGSQDTSRARDTTVSRAPIGANVSLDQARVSLRKGERAAAVKKASLLLEHGMHDEALFAIKVQLGDSRDEVERYLGRPREEYRYGSLSSFHYCTSRLWDVYGYHVVLVMDHDQLVAIEAFKDIAWVGCGEDIRPPHWNAYERG